MSPTLFLVVAIVVLAFVLWNSRERFQPEFIDKRQVQKTVASEDSHYSQVTNHMNPAPTQMGPLSGMASPFQVNQYKAYIQ
jgi:hypothetical protein